PWAEPPLNLTTGMTLCGATYARRLEVGLPAGIRASAIALVGHLQCGDDIPQGTDVATLDVATPAGVAAHLPLVAGVNIADRLLSDPQHRAAAGHRVPPAIFDDPQLPPNSYLIRADLPQPTAGARLVIQTQPMKGWVAIDRMTIVDDRGVAHPQSIGPLALADGQRFREVMRFKTSRLTDRPIDETSDLEKQYVVYENLRAMPRAWIVNETRTLDEEHAFDPVRYSQFANGDAFDPAHLAIVEPDIGGAATRTMTPGAAGARVSSIDGPRIVVDVTAEHDAFLVLSEAYYPGWQARIDDAASRPVQKADVMFQGVPVPAGHHTVTFELVSTTLRAGSAISLLALIIAVVLGSTTASRGV
ncbi:MAG TPA: YfhO family protein, partial [Vicinamibacterales bacterium]